MKINSNSFIQAAAASPSTGAVMPDQGTSFAASLEKAAAAGQDKKTTADKSAEDAKLKAACKDMEAVFLNLMLSKMRATVPKSDLLGNRSQEDMMTSLLDTELTKNMSQAGGMGLADMLYRQLSKPTVKSQAAR